MNAGIPSSAPAYGVNMLCGSGLKAVALGYQAVLSDESAVIVAGGQESMSQVWTVCLFICKYNFPFSYEDQCQYSTSVLNAVCVLCLERIWLELATFPTASIKNKSQGLIFFVLGSEELHVVTITTCNALFKKERTYLVSPSVQTY